MRRRLAYFSLILSSAVAATIKDPVQAQQFAPTQFQNISTSAVASISSGTSETSSSRVRITVGTDQDGKPVRSDSSGGSDNTSSTTRKSESSTTVTHIQPDPPQISPGRGDTTTTGRDRNLSVTPTSLSGSSITSFSTTTTSSVELDRDGNPAPTDDSRPRRPPNNTTLPANCIDTVITYTNAIPITVYVTTEIPYNVTVSASNMSMTAPTLYETPREPCKTEIVTTAEPVVGTLSSGSRPFLPTSVFSNTMDLIKQTSTVVVTKKTPVQIVETATGPPVTFIQPTQTKDGNGPTNGIVPSDTGNNGPGSGQSSNPTGVATLAPTGGGDSKTSSDIKSRLSAIESVGGGIASIINSVINSPFVLPPPSPTGRFIAIPATSTINGIPVTIGPSNVAIGSQTIGIPISSQATVVVGSQTFTVKPSEIVAAGTTVSIASQLSDVSTITQAPSVVATAGITFTIGSSAAIISGTTYRIGTGAASTTVVIGGQTIAIGSEGVVVSGASPTTYAPPMTIANGYEIVVVNGLTVSVDQTAAVISGTTYRIGAGATTTTINVGGTTIIIGPSGVIFPSTTIRPTNVPTITKTSIPISTEQASSGNSNSQNSANNLRDSDVINIFTGLLAILPLIFTFI